MACRIKPAAVRWNAIGCVKSQAAELQGTVFEAAQLRRTCLMAMAAPRGGYGWIVCRTSGAQLENLPALAAAGRSSRCVAAA
jgi:hypothetical protein